MDANQQNGHNYLSSCSFHILTCRRCLDIGLPPVRFCGTKGGQGLIDTPPGVGGGSRILAANGQIGQFLAAEVILAAQAARLSSAAKDLNGQ